MDEDSERCFCFNQPLERRAALKVALGMIPGLNLGALIAAGYQAKGYWKDVPIPQGGVLWVFAVSK